MVVDRSGMRAVLAALLILIVARALPAGAKQNGITGYSGKQGATCNDDCHVGGVTPLVRFDGPQRVLADTIATFRFVVTSQAAKQKVAGFNVAADDGLLAVLPDQGERFEFDELTHDAPKPNVGSEASWLFTWHVPAQLGIYQLYGAGLSANGNGTDGGDDSNLTTLSVTVTDQPVGDANCDTRVSAADTTAVVIQIPSAGVGACAGVDVNGDGVVDARDLGVLVAALFGD